MIKKLILLISILVLLQQPALCDDTFGHAIGYGFAGFSQLSDFAPPSASKALHLLMNRNFTEARVELQQQYAQHPGSLPIFIGLAQVTPDLWSGQINALQQNGVNTLSASDKFKLAVLLYYSWETQSQSHTSKNINDAQDILAGLWNLQHAPMIGSILAGTLSVNPRPDNPVLKSLYPLKIEEYLVEPVGGEAVYRSFREAEARDWQWPPPSLQVTPTANRQALLGIVSALRSLHSARNAPAHLVNGSYTPDPMPPYTPKQMVANRYFAAWYDELIKSLT